MKFTKKFWSVIGAGIFVIALAALGTVIFQQVDEKGQLNKKLASSQSQLEGLQLGSLPSQQTELEQRLNRTIPEFESLKAKLTQPVSSTFAATVLFDVAKTYGLVLTSMTSSSPTLEKVKGVTLLSMSVSAKVEGNVSKVVNYVAALNNLLKTSAIKSVEITIPEMTNGDNVSASIEMVIYSYRGE